MIGSAQIREIREIRGWQVDLDLGARIYSLTQDEAAKILDAFDEFKFRMTAPDRESPKAEKKPVPDPTDGAETGCEECKKNGIKEPCEACSPPPAPEQKPAAKKTGKRTGGSIITCMKSTPKERGKGSGAFGIPKSLFKENKREYQRLWGICKEHGLTYEQALVHKRNKPGKSPKKSEPAVIEPAQALPSSNEVKEPAKEPHKESVPWPGQAKLRELTKSVNGELKIGQMVKHNGSKASPFFGQIGETVNINKEELQVRFPGGSTRLPSYLVLKMPVVQA